MHMYMYNTHRVSCKDMTGSIQARGTAHQNLSKWGGTRRSNGLPSQAQEPRHRASQQTRCDLVHAANTWFPMAESTTWTTSCASTLLLGHCLIGCRMAGRDFSTSMTMRLRVRQFWSGRMYSWCLRPRDHCVTQRDVNMDRDVWALLGTLSRCRKRRQRSQRASRCPTSHKSYIRGHDGDEIHGDQSELTSSILVSQACHSTGWVGERAHKFTPSLLFCGYLPPYLRVRSFRSLYAHVAQSSTMRTGGALRVSGMVSPGWPAATGPGHGDTAVRGRKQRSTSECDER